MDLKDLKVLYQKWMKRNFKKIMKMKSIQGPVDLVYKNQQNLPMIVLVG